MSWIKIVLICLMYAIIFFPLGMLVIKIAGFAGALIGDPRAGMSMGILLTLGWYMGTVQIHFTTSKKSPPQSS